MHRQRDERRCKGAPTLTELSAGFLGALRHLGKSCKSPGRWASGHSRLGTSTLTLLPHLPFPFLTPSHSLPLCIFKPVKLPQLHLPILSTGGGGQGLLHSGPLWAASLALAVGGWGGGRPQAQGTRRARETNHRPREWSPLGGGLSGGLASGWKGAGSQACPQGCLSQASVSGGRAGSSEEYCG